MLRLLSFIFLTAIFSFSNLYSESLDDYFKKFGKYYQNKSGGDYPIYYTKKDTSYLIPQVIARTYVPLTKEEFVRAIRECKHYSEFLPGQSKDFPTNCAPVAKDGTFVQTAVMDLPWPAKDLKYKTTVFPFDLSKNVLVEKWINISVPSESQFGQTSENKGSWSIVLPDNKGFFLQYEFLVVPSTKVPNSIKAWLADAALKEIIESIVNRAYDKNWNIDKKRSITYKKIQVKDLRKIY